jgi:hypothetical protein
MEPMMIPVDLYSGTTVMARVATGKMLASPTKGTAGIETGEYHSIIPLPVVVLENTHHTRCSEVDAMVALGTELFSEWFM